MSDFTLHDYSSHLTLESTYGMHPHMATAAGSFAIDHQNNAWAGGPGINNAPAGGPPPSVPTSTPVQPSITQEDAQRQIVELLTRLHETPHHSPASSTSNDACILNPQLMDETVKAADGLISIFDSLQIYGLSTAPIEPLISDAAIIPCSFINAGTGFLIAACYEHIFRNSNALAMVLHNAVYSNDMSTLRSLPSINIGSVTSSRTTSPAVQSALWAQLLWQSLRELEKRLLTSHLRSGGLSPPATDSFHRPGTSHLVDLTAAADAEIARLEFSVNHLLETTLNTLRRKSV